VTAELGLTTDTYDQTGQVLTQAEWAQVQAISPDMLKKVTQELVGQLDQTVPAFSAVKRQGLKLYELARANQLDLTTLPSRQVQVYEAQLLSDELDQSQTKRLVSWRLKCSSGTYIRSWVHDLGQRLGVGATVTALRRTAIGELRVSEALSLVTS
jgi:tRNA pseudouridine55 synthase